MTCGIERKHLAEDPSKLQAHLTERLTTPTPSLGASDPAAGFLTFPGSLLMLVVVNSRREFHLLPTFDDTTITDEWAYLRNTLLAVLLNTFLLGIFLVRRTFLSPSVLALETAPDSAYDGNSLGHGALTLSDLSVPTRLRRTATSSTFRDIEPLSEPLPSPSPL